MNHKLLLVSFLVLFSNYTQAQQASTQALDATAENSQGQYAPMDMGYAGFTSLGMTQSAWLDPLQNLGEGQIKPAYSRYYWNKDLVLPIRLREAMVTMINFPEWEMIEDVKLGDGSMFNYEIIGPNNVLLFPAKGAAVGVDTNGVMFGRSGNRYVFYIKSESVDTERLTNSIIDIEVVGDEGSSSSSFSGGGKSNKTMKNSSKSGNFTKRFQKEDWLKEIPFDPAKLRFDVEVYIPNPDDVVIAPERVWRDDVFTYIDLGKKALNMNQRPIVTMVVERSETPVGFRTKGPDNRLIIVEGIGDLVMRNGKRMICLKLRRDDAKGIDDATYADDDTSLPSEWDVPSPLPDNKGKTSNIGGRTMMNMGNGFDNDSEFQAEVTEVNFRDSNNPKSVQGFNNQNANNFTSNRGGGNGGYNNNSSAIVKQYGYGSGFVDSDINSNISVQLGTDANVSNMENLWSSLSEQYPDVLKKYQPFFSVDAPADGQGKELFHLRVGPIQSLEEGDKVCGKLGRSGVFCSVVRTQ